MQNDVIKKTKLARKAGILAGSVFFIILAIFFAKPSQNKSINLRVANNELFVEIAKTSQQKEKGLCCRDTLAQNSGMLFAYDKPGIYRYWMKDTRIPLDMYWINSQKEIIHIEKNVQPSSFPTTYGPETPAQYVLETNAGYADKHKITSGQVVDFSL